MPPFELLILIIGTLALTFGVVRATRREVVNVDPPEDDEFHQAMRRWTQMLSEAQK